MRLRNITGCREMIGESEFVVHEPEMMKGKWREAFGNDHPVYVEIGMGKGRFLMDMARLTRKSTLSVSKNIPACCCVRFRSWRRKSCLTFA